MPFTATFAHLDEREPWKNEYYNQLVRDLSTSLTALDGAAFASPFTLAGDVDGDGNAIYGFARWFGSSVTGVCIRDATGYGAKGDGSTDDTAAIQAAIDDCPTTGGFIFVPPGSYKITGNGIYMGGSSGSARSNITICGAGPGTILDISDGGIAINMGHSDGTSYMLVSDLQIYHDTPADTNLAAIVMKDSSYSTIRNVYINGSRGYGIDVSGVLHGMVRNCHIENVPTTGIGQRSYTIGGVSGFYPSSCVQIIGCTIDTPGYDGIALYHGNNFIVHDCKIKAAGYSGIRAISGVLTGIPNAVHNVTVVDCDISGCGTVNAAETSYNGAGIVAAMKYNNQPMYGVVISGNIIHDNLRAGIHLSGYDLAALTEFSITANTISGNTTTGIEAWMVRNGTISGNTSTDNGTYGLQIGAAYSCHTMHVSVTGNAFTDSAAAQDYGIYNQGATEYSVFANNVCEGTAADISIAGNASWNSTCQYAHNIGTIV